jgi:hypothetical protein
MKNRNSESFSTRKEHNMSIPAPITNCSSIMNGGLILFTASLFRLSLCSNASTYGRSRGLRTLSQFLDGRVMKAAVFFLLLPVLGMADDRRAENDKVGVAGEQATEPLGRSKRPLVGAIRWDGWGLKHPVGEGSEQVLGLAKHQHRAPFFVAEAGPDFIRFKPYSQETMDTEIDYAVHAGIDYWAFCWYPPGCGMEVGRNLFLSSRKQQRPKWCVILGKNPFDMGRDAPWLAAEFAKPEYQKVLDGRPLVYLFTPMSRADLSTLRELSLKSCGKSPYVAMMGWTATSAAQACEAVGADAITRYAGGEGGSWGDYAKAAPRGAMLSDVLHWQAADAPILEIEAAFTSATPTTQVDVEIQPFEPADRTDFPAWEVASPAIIEETARKQKAFPTAPPIVIPLTVPGDGQLRTHTLKLADHPAYRGAMKQLRLRFPATDGTVDVRRIELRR